VRSGSRVHEHQLKDQLQWILLSRNEITFRYRFRGNERSSSRSGRAGSIEAEEKGLTELSSCVTSTKRVDAHAASACNRVFSLARSLVDAARIEERVAFRRGINAVARDNVRAS